MASAALPIDSAAEAALEALRARTPVVLLTGRAGTGKSHFIRQLMRKEAKVPQVVLAPTGLAAMNIGGQTVHSFFGLPPRSLIGFNEKPSWFFSKQARALRRIIVDEVSMLRADMLDAMDKNLRAARKSDRPFGGVQMLLVGDFYQLPPVVRSDEGQLFEEAGYASPFAFSAQVMREADVAAFELTEMRRQTDAEFIALLESIRERSNLREAVETLNARCCNQPGLPGAVLLTSTNAVADSYNQRGMEALPGTPKTFSGGFQGELPKNFAPADRLPAPINLTLKAGARVIFTQNDLEGRKDEDEGERWVNGTLGRVQRIEEDAVFVLIDGAKEPTEVRRATWPQARWVWNEAEKVMKAEEQFRYLQFPLAPAWAITIHKAQGMTLDAVEVDLGRGAFAAGQTYVALSRARSLAGLRLTRPLTARDVMVDPTIAEGLRRFS